MTLEIIKAFQRENCQLNDGDRIIFNHETIAIYLKHHYPTTEDKRVFLLAGTDDLNALLRKAEIFSQDQELFIMLRPFTHMMFLYIRYENQKANCYLFDSQVWGTRYYPNRLILEALRLKFGEDLKVFFNGTCLQDQNNQVGCTHYSIAVLDYCYQHGMPFESTEAKCELQYWNGIPFYSVPEDDFPAELLLIKDTQDPTWPQKSIEKKLNQLLPIFAEHYIEEAKINREKVDAVVSELQGYDLPENYLCSDDAEYAIEVQEQQVIIRFNNVNYLYSNCLIYTEGVYPNYLKHSSNRKYIGEKVKHVHDEAQNRFELRYHADNINELVTFFQQLPTQRHTYFQQHMRQQSGLRRFANEVQLALTYYNITREETGGGLDQDQVQTILRYLFKKMPTIYVPTCTELSGEHAYLSLDELNAKGYQHVVFSLQATKEHQVAVSVNCQTRVAQVCNSKTNISIDSRHINRLCENFDEGSDITIVHTTSGYAEQPDNWSCGIFVICNLMKLHDHPDAEKNTAIEAHAILRKMYRIYLHQESNKNIYFDDKVKKQCLCNILDEHTNTQSLKLITQFLKQDNHRNEVLHPTSLDSALVEYTHLNPNDQFGLFILQASNKIVSIALDKFETIMRGFIELYQAQNESDRKLVPYDDETIRNIMVEIGFHQGKEKVELIEKILLLLLNIKISTEEKLNQLLLVLEIDKKYLDDHIWNVAPEAFIFRLAKNLLLEYANYKQNSTSHKNCRRKESEKQLAVLKDNEAKIRHVVSQLGLELTPQQYILLSKSLFLRGFMSVCKKMIAANVKSMETAVKSNFFESILSHEIYLLILSRIKKNNLTEFMRQLEHLCAGEIYQFALNANVRNFREFKLLLLCLPVHERLSYAVHIIPDTPCEEINEMLAALQREERVDYLIAFLRQFLEATENLTGEDTLEDIWDLKFLRKWFCHNMLEVGKDCPAEHQALPSDILHKIFYYSLISVNAISKKMWLHNETLRNDFANMPVCELKVYFDEAARNNKPYIVNKLWEYNAKFRESVLEAVLDDRKRIKVWEKIISLPSLSSTAIFQDLLNACADVNFLDSLIDHTKLRDQRAAAMLKVRVISLCEELARSNAESAVMILGIPLPRQYYNVYKSPYMQDFIKVCKFLNASSRFTSFSDEQKTDILKAILAYDIYTLLLSRCRNEDEFYQQLNYLLNNFFLFAINSQVTRSSEALALLSIMPLSQRGFYAQLTISKTQPKDVPSVLNCLPISLRGQYIEGYIVYCTNYNDIMQVKGLWDINVFKDALTKNQISFNREDKTNCFTIRLEVVKKYFLCSLVASPDISTAMWKENTALRKYLTSTLPFSEISQYFYQALHNGCSYISDVLWTHNTWLRKEVLDRAAGDEAYLSQLFGLFINMPDIADLEVFSDLLNEIQDVGYLRMLLDPGRMVDINAIVMVNAHLANLLEANEEENSEEDDQKEDNKELGHDIKRMKF